MDSSGKEWMKEDLLNLLLRLLKEDKEKKEKEKPQEELYVLASIFS